MMTQLIMSRPVSGCFATSLAPIDIFLNHLSFRWGILALAGGSLNLSMWSRRTSKQWPAQSFLHHFQPRWNRTRRPYGEDNDSLLA